MDENKRDNIVGFPCGMAAQRILKSVLQLRDYKGVKF